MNRKVKKNQKKKLLAECVKELYLPAKKEIEMEIERCKRTIKRYESLKPDKDLSEQDVRDWNKSVARSLAYYRKELSKKKERLKVINYRMKHIK